MADFARVAPTSKHHPPRGDDAQSNPFRVEQVETIFDIIELAATMLAKRGTRGVALRKNWQIE
jgi:hypothetical protein